MNIVKGVAIKLNKSLSGNLDFQVAVKSSIALLVRIFGALISLIFNLIIARQLGLTEAGYFFLCLSIVLLLSSISRLGFDNTVLRYTAFQVGTSKTIIKIFHFAIFRIAPLAIILGLMMFFGASSLADIVFNDSDLTTSLKFISPAILGLSVVVILSMSLQARGKIILSSISQNSAHFLLCGALIIFLNIRSAGQAALYLSFCLGLTACFFYWLSIRDLNQNEGQIDKREILLSSRANWLTSIMSQLTQLAPPIMVGVFLASENVAIFTVALRIVILTSVVLMAVNAVVAPMLAKFSAKKDLEGMRRTAIFSVRLLIIFTSPLIIFMFFYPDFFMGLFGSEYIQGAHLLKILLVGQTVNVICGSVGFLLLMSGHERDIRLVTAICGLGILIFTPFMIKLYGETGAAFCVSFFLAAQNLWAVIFVQRRFGFNTLIFWQKI